MPSTTWENMNANSTMVVFGDTAPWGGFSNLNTFSNVRVRSVQKGVGGDFDTAQLIMSEAEFGDEMVHDTPIKIIAISGEGINAIQTTVFRGFVTRNLGRVDENSEEVTVECLGYKYFLSKITKIQGRIYAHDDATGTPATEGSGLSIGGQKLTFEKFRIQNDAQQGNYLRNEECVFNRNGIPDCKTLTHSNVQVCFYMPKISYEEISGLTTTHATPKEWEGHKWSWATILGHIERFWISPYTGTGNKIEFSTIDMQRVANIDDDYGPIGFSLEGMNPMQAIDTVVQALPGRWYWYMDYTGFNTIKIRIQQHGQVTGKTVNLRLCPKNSANKMCEVNSNIESADSTSDSTASFKYCAAFGGNVKLVTTVKLVPLWPKYSGNDFSSQDDYEKWKKYMFHSDEAYKAQFETDFPNEAARYKKIYTEYGIPMRGQDFKAQIPALSTLQITGDLYSEYREYEKDVLNFFFSDAHIIRQIQPPNFNRYSDAVKVFMYDSRHTGLYNGDSQVTLQEFKQASGLEGDRTSLSDEGVNDSKWINPEDSSDSYEFDEKNGIVRFSTPQFERLTKRGVSLQDAMLQTLSESNYDGSQMQASGRTNSYGRTEAQAAYDAGEGGGGSTTQTKNMTKISSRTVYMTATFSSDVATVAGKRAVGVFDETAGAPYTERLDQGNNSLIIHKGAYYPVSWNNNSGSVQYRTDTFDEKIIGTRVIKAEQFPNYNIHIGNGGDEVKRAVLAYIENFQRVHRTINVTMPYLETGYVIGDKLYNIQNSKYTNLNMSLEEIQYIADNDSDQYKTSYQFTNIHKGNPGRPQVAINLRQQVEALLGIRIPYEFRL